jgi:hypothetical protein
MGPGWRGLVSPGKSQNLRGSVKLPSSPGGSGERMPGEGEFGAIDKGLVGHIFNMIFPEVKIKLIPRMPEPDHGRSTRLR